MACEGHVLKGQVNLGPDSIGVGSCHLPEAPIVAQPRFAPVLEGCFNNKCLVITPLDPGFCWDAWP